MGCALSRSTASVTTRTSALDARPPVPPNEDWEPPSNSKLLLLFGDLNRAISDFCEAAVPLPTPISPVSLASSSILATAHANFSTRVIECLYDRIFYPFHPCLSVESSEIRHREFERKFQQRR